METDVSNVLESTNIDISNLLEDKGDYDLKDKELLNEEMVIHDIGVETRVDTSIKDPNISIGNREDILLMSIKAFAEDMESKGKSTRDENERYHLLKMKESVIYREMNQIKTLGSDANMPKVNKVTARMAWRNTRLILQGPAYLRSLWRKPVLKYKYLHETEVTQIEKTRKDKVLWNKILNGIEDYVPPSERPPTDEEIRASRAHNFEVGNFHLLRNKPSALDARLSKHMWGRGIYINWNGNLPFPYATGIDQDMAASNSVLKDDVPYQRYKDRDNSNNYILKGNTEASDQFTTFWRRRCLKLAEDAFMELTQKKAEKERLYQIELKRKRLEEKKLRMKAKRLALLDPEGLDVVRAKMELSKKAEELVEMVKGPPGFVKMKANSVKNILKLGEKEEGSDEEKSDGSGEDDGDGKPPKKASRFQVLRKLIQTRLSSLRSEKKNEVFSELQVEDSNNNTNNNNNDDNNDNNDVELKTKSSSFEERKKNMFKKLNQIKRNAKINPYVVKEPEPEPVVVVEVVDDGKKKRKKFARRSVTGKNKVRAVGTVVQSKLFAESHAPPDKKFLKEQERLRRKAEQEAERLEKERREAQILLDLQKQTPKQQKFAIKTDAELEADRMKKWFSDKTDVLMVDTLFKVRLLERETQRRYRNLSKFFGVYVGRELDQSADILRAACLNGRFKEVVDILEDGLYDANTLNSLGDTAFFAVVQRALVGHGETDHDDDENEIPVGCWSILKDAIKKRLKKKSSVGRLDIILKILTVKGGNVNFIRVPKDKAEDGLALVHLAARSKSKHMLDWLHAKDANMNILTSINKLTPLMMAAKNGAGEILRSLLHIGAMDSINFVDSGGWSALHYASAYCESEYVLMLLICGADVSVRSGSNRLPIEEAKCRGRMENVEVIMLYKDQSRMFTHQINFQDQEMIRSRVLDEQDQANRLKEGRDIFGGHLASGMNALASGGLASLRKLGASIREDMNNDLSDDDDD